MTGTIEDESALIAALRKGDEAVFAQLVDQHTPSLLRVARGYVSSHEIAEEVVQETWIALIKGIAKFEGRSSLRTWLFTVMINIAKARGIRERRDSDTAIAAFTGGTVDPRLFRGPDEEWPGDWKDWKESQGRFPRPPKVLCWPMNCCGRPRGTRRLPDRQRSSSLCVTCSDSTPARCVSSLTLASRISGYSSTEVGQQFVSSWRATWGSVRE